MHGGAAPQVKAKAAERIRLLAEGPGLDALAELVALRKNPAVRLAAARDLLDRAGYGAHQKVDLSVVRDEAAALAAEFGIPLEQVYRYAGLPVPN